MIPVVITPPPVMVTAAQAKAVKVFADDDDSGYVSGLLEIAQAQIDGPSGWLRRAIGLQTLEVKFDADCNWSNYDLLPPYVDTISNTEADGIRTLCYRAGYAKALPADAPAQLLPAPIKHAIILMAGVLRATVPDEEGALKTRTVDGMGSWTYALPDGAADAMQKAAERLLAPYKVLRV